MSSYRAYLQIHVEADNLNDAYNRIEIAMMRWPLGLWRLILDPDLITDECLTERRSNSPGLEHVGKTLVGKSHTTEEGQ